ncbi:MAG: DUF393 domain-containing protein [Sulfurovum sp.]|nr:DUF393 domain-containing protein [Sulfurovum sp.]
MKQKLTLYYDLECPFCNRYARFVKLNDCYDLQLKDAREYHAEILSLCKDMDINDGIIVFAEGKCLQGIDALSYLDISMEKKGLLSRLHGIWNIKKSVSHPLYAFIKVLRKIVLFLMGRKSHIQ